MIRWPSNKKVIMISRLKYAGNSIKARQHLEREAILQAINEATTRDDVQEILVALTKRIYHD